MPTCSYLGAIHKGCPVKEGGEGFVKSRQTRTWNRGGREGLLTERMSYPKWIFLHSSGNFICFTLILMDVFWNINLILAKFPSKQYQNEYNKKPVYSILYSFTRLVLCCLLFSAATLVWISYLLYDFVLFS